MRGAGKAMGKKITFGEREGARREGERAESWREERGRKGRFGKCQWGEEGKGFKESGGVEELQSLHFLSE